MARGMKKKYFGIFPVVVVAPNFRKGFESNLKGRSGFLASRLRNDFLLFPLPFFSSPSLISLFKSVMQIDAKRSFAYKVFASKRLHVK